VGGPVKRPLHVITEDIEFPTTPDALPDSSEWRRARARWTERLVPAIEYHLWKHAKFGEEYPDVGR
jgi:hypothetical protein